MKYLKYLLDIVIIGEQHSMLGKICDQMIWNRFYLNCDFEFKSFLVTGFDFRLERNYFDYFDFDFKSVLTHF